MSAIVAAALVISCGGAQPAEETTAPDAETAAPAPAKSTDPTPVTGDFSLKDVDGKLYTLSDYLGENVIIISYFTTWCEPCRKELVEFEKLYQAHKDQGVMLLAVAMDLPETRGDVRPFAKKYGFTFPVLLDEDLKAADMFNPRREAPFGLVIDLDKNQIWSHMGYVPGDEKQLEVVVLSAVEKGAAAPKDETESMSTEKGDTPADETAP